MPDGLQEIREQFITIPLCKKDTQYSQAYSDSPTCLVSALRLTAVPGFLARHSSCSDVSRGQRRISNCVIEAEAPILTACWHNALWRTQQQLNSTGEVL